MTNILYIDLFFWRYLNALMMLDVYLLFVCIAIGISNELWFIKAYMHSAEVAIVLGVIAAITLGLIACYTLVGNRDTSKLNEILFSLQSFDSEDFIKLYSLYYSYKLEYRKFTINAISRRHLSRVVIISLLCLWITSIVYMLSIYVNKSIMCLFIAVEALVIYHFINILEILFPFEKIDYPDDQQLLKINTVLVKLAKNRKDIDENLLLRIISKGLRIKLMKNRFDCNKYNKNEMHLRLEMALPFIFDNTKLEIIDEEGKYFIVELENAPIRDISNKYIIDILLSEEIVLNEKTMIELTIYNKEKQVAIVYFEQYNLNQYRSVDFVLTKNLNNRQWNRKECVDGYRVE